MFKKAIKQLENGQFEQNLAEIFVNVIDTRYATAEGENNRPWISGIKKNKKSVTVFAKGEDVVFKEFGAGVQTNNPRKIQGIYPGSFSASEKGTGEFAQYGSWHYHKEKYTGVKSTNAFEKGIQNVQKLAEREFYKILEKSIDD